MILPNSVFHRLWQLYTIVINDACRTASIPRTNLLKRREWRLGDEEVASSLPARSTLLGLRLRPRCIVSTVAFKAPDADINGLLR